LRWWLNQAENGAWLQQALAHPLIWLIDSRQLRAARRLVWPCS